MIPDYSGAALNRCRHRNCNGSHGIENWNPLLGPRRHHRVARSNNGLAAGVGLRHLRRTAHLRHLRTAFAFLDSHGAVRRNACQKRSGGP